MLVQTWWVARVAWCFCQKILKLTKGSKLTNKFYNLCYWCSAHSLRSNLWTTLLLPEFMGQVDSPLMQVVQLSSNEGQSKNSSQRVLWDSYVYQVHPSLAWHLFKQSLALLVFVTKSTFPRHCPTALHLGCWGSQFTCPEAQFLQFSVLSFSQLPYNTHPFEFPKNVNHWQPSTKSKLVQESKSGIYSWSNYNRPAPITFALL